MPGPLRSSQNPRIRLKQAGIGGILSGYTQPREPVVEAAIFAKSLLKPSRPSLPTPNPRVPDLTGLPDVLKALLVPPEGGVTDRAIREGRKAVGSTLIEAGSMFEKSKRALKGYQTFLDLLGGRR